jgi:adenosylhomocysteine nucleosidase
VLVECGIGKVNAARTTQILIDNFEIEYVVNIGTAGAISSNLNITDVVIAEKLVQYDFDISAFGHEKGYITGIGKYINADKSLVEEFKNAMNRIEEDKNYKVHVGTIASGDTFCTDRKNALKIYEDFGAICVEMEGASIAQICLLDNIPFIVIRGISDSPNGNNNIDFDEYLSISSKRCASFLNEMLK